MRTRRVVALVIGCVLVLPALALLLGGIALAAAYTFGRDDGYFTGTLDRVATDTAAVTTGDLEFGADPGSPAWLVDALDADVRLQVEPATGERSLFLGIGPEADVAAYLANVAHEEIIDVDRGFEPEYRAVPGTAEARPPGEETFWVAATSGPGPQELTWEATDGRWAAVLMNADGSPGVAARVEVGVKSDIVLPLTVGMLVVGLLLGAGAVLLIVVGASGRAGEAGPPGDAPASLPPPEGSAAPPAPWAAPTAGRRDPVQLRATLDPDVSRWQWLVKWFLAIPHWIVLAFLWLAFVVLTVVAWFAILFTGRYPRGIFDFNVGVLRWSWRVSYYATTGGIGTDRYPPFTLREQPGDLARLDVEYPPRLSRPMVLVKWFLAIPHLIIVALVAGGSVRWLAAEGDRVWFDPTGGGGLLGILVLVAGVVLLVSGRYPESLFELIVGLNRWVYRVIAYVALMTDRYPPFRLDQGGDEPAPVPPRPPGPAPTVVAAMLLDPPPAPGAPADRIATSGSAATTRPAETEADDEREPAPG
jgi:hypothetical protein